MRPRVALALVAGLLLSLPACRPPRRPVPAQAPERPARALGTTIQAGAFARVENAARLSARLQDLGLDATYFAAPDGLYKVRFGDFPDRESARRRAEALRREGVLEVYYLVAPEPIALEPGKVPELRERLVARARSFLGVPYLWGGTNGDGFDCSGLVWAVYRLDGLRIPRSSREQWEQGQPVERARLQKGDLLFFATGAKGQVSHVGLYAGGGRFVHASRQGSTIREESLDSPYFRERYLGARSYL